MGYRLPIFMMGLVLSRGTFAQSLPAGVPPPDEQQAPRGTSQTAPVPQPGNQPVPQPFRPSAAGSTGATGGAPIQPLNLTLDDALRRARIYSQVVYSAEIGAQLAREDIVQARAALLPTMNWFHQVIYTQPNGLPSGVFVSNDGPRVYNNQALVHGDIFAPVKYADYRRATAAEAVARAKADIAVRGLFATVVQNYYGTVVAQRKVANAQQSLKEAQQFADITAKQEQGGEVAHADVVRAQALLEQRQRDLQDAEVTFDRARIGFSVLLFQDYNQQFSVADDLERAPVLPPFNELRALASKNNPDLRAAQATVRQQTHEISSAKAAMLPSLSFDYFYGINANQYAVYDREGFRNLGNVAQAQVTLPLWTWGALRSKVKQAELKLVLARNDLTLAQRTVLANLNSFYLEADTAVMQVASLQRSLDLSNELLKLTLERYQAGESTALEVQDAQTLLALARNAYLDGVMRYRMAVGNLQTITGIF
jgi:outer membrane protein TolC